MIYNNDCTLTERHASLLKEYLKQLTEQELLVIGLPTPGWGAFDAKQDFRLKRLKIQSAKKFGSRHF